MNKITYEQQHLDRILGMQAKYSLLCLQNEFQKDLQEMMNAPSKRNVLPYFWLLLEASSSLKTLTTLS
jgi:hypothetical protein